MDRITARLEIAPGITLAAEWSGGAYVDLSRAGAAAPSEVINVWNDATNAPAIPFTHAGLREAMIAWVKSYRDDAIEDEARAALAHDMREHWGR